MRNVVRRWRVIISEENIGITREYLVTTNRRYKAVYLALLRFVKAYGTTDRFSHTRTLRFTINIWKIGKRVR